MKIQRWKKWMLGALAALALTGTGVGLRLSLSRSNPVVEYVKNLGFSDKSIVNQFKPLGYDRVMGNNEKAPIDKSYALSGSLQIHEERLNYLRDIIQGKQTTAHEIDRLGKLDHDGDGLDLRQELYYGTNPLDQDSDKDGMSDLYEVICGVNVGGWQNPTIHNDRIAVIYIGGWDKDNNHSVYWNRMIDQYDLLLAYGYTDDDIIVFYADGNVPNSVNCYDYQDCRGIESHKNIIDYDARDGTITNFFKNTLEGIIDSNDLLYIWVYDHGKRKFGINFFKKKAAICCWLDDNTRTDDYIIDSEVKDWIDDLKYNRLAVVLAQCFSGGFIDDLKHLPNSVILTACGYEPSCDYLDQPAGFMYHYYCSLNPSSGDLMKGTAKYTPGQYTNQTPDEDGNGFVSLLEAFKYAEENDNFHGHVPDCYETPQYWDTDGLGKTTYL